MEALPNAVMPHIMEIVGHHVLICVVLVVVTTIVFLDHIFIVMAVH